MRIESVRILYKAFAFAEVKDKSGIAYMLNFGDSGRACLLADGFSLKRCGGKFLFDSRSLNSHGYIDVTDGSVHMVSETVFFS